MGDGCLLGLYKPGPANRPDFLLPRIADSDDDNVGNEIEWLAKRKKPRLVAAPG